MQKTISPLFLIWLFCCNSFAKTTPTIGKVAQNINEQVTLFSNFINSACLLLGAAFVFASLIKYIEHKKSPLMVTLSTVFFLLITGLVFLIFPLLHLLQS